MEALLGLFVSIVVAGLIIWLLLYAISYIGIPEPFNKVLRVVIIVIGVIYLIKLLLPLL